MRSSCLFVLMRTVGNYNLRHNTGENSYFYLTLQGCNKSAEYLVAKRRYSRSGVDG